MSATKLPQHLLQELPSISDFINYPLKSALRIKYTCFDVSKHLIVFGATSGGLYVFNRDPCEFVQLIPNKDGAVTRLAISPDERHVAFANGRGAVTVTQCDQELGGGHESLASKEHHGNEVTALAWGPGSGGGGGGGVLFAGDDVGNISLLQLPNFISKTMFASTTQIIMSLDSRVCQLEVRGRMLLASTQSRAFVCDTRREQYRQIGHKLRDGEFGACFVTAHALPHNGAMPEPASRAEVNKYSIVDGDVTFDVNEKLANTKIFCARPSSRLWEASIDGTVERTHQFKQVFARKAANIISVGSYNIEDVEIEPFSNENDGRSCNFPKIFSMNGAIFSFRKDALYFMNTEDLDVSMWFQLSNDIVDCKVLNSILYVWLQNGSLVTLRFMKIDKYIVKCFLDEKFLLSGKLCALYKDYLLNNTLSSKTYVLVGLREKLKDNYDLSERIEEVIIKIEDMKSNDSKVMRSGIHIVDNTYNANLFSDGEDNGVDFENEQPHLAPEALQTLKDLSISVSDKLITSKKILKETWVDFEGKMKNFSGEKFQPPEIILPRREVEERQDTENAILPVYDEEIIFKETSQKAEEIDVKTEEQDTNAIEKKKLCKALYQYYRLRLVGQESEISNVNSIIDRITCDITEIYQLMLTLEEYCCTIGAVEESKCIPNNIFLIYLSESENKDKHLDEIINDELLYEYFVKSCIAVNLKTQKLSEIGCECGYPLPSASSQAPEYCDIIDRFIEKQWSSAGRARCLAVCRRMPQLWRRVLLLRRHDDLRQILHVLLQLLDERLLARFVPQFTRDTWSLALRLFASLRAERCLACARRFPGPPCARLDWAGVGRLLLASLGARDAVRVLRDHAALLHVGELGLRFVHSSLLVGAAEALDPAARDPIIDAIYAAHEHEDARLEICALLRSRASGHAASTALPLVVAAKSAAFGLGELAARCGPGAPLARLVAALGDAPCALCGLPLANPVLRADGGLWAFRCGHLYHGACLNHHQLKLCPDQCSVKLA